jgi:subtilisin family serine protease
MPFRIRLARRSFARPITRRKTLVVELLEDRTLLSAGGEVYLLTTPNDPSFGSLWGMSKIGAPAAWDTQRGSMKVAVAVIDTGIDYNHVDLYKNIWINQAEIPASVVSAIKSDPLWDTDGDGLITFWGLNDSRNQGPGKITNIVGDSRITAADILASSADGGWADGASTDGNSFVDDLIGWDFVNNDNNPMDDNNHGTHVSGTIGAMGNNGVGVVGVNWKVELMALKILNASGRGDLADIVDAVEYSGANGAKVSNNSYGYSDNGETVDGSKYWEVYDAIAETPQVLFVASAGNNSLNNDTNGFRNYPSSYNLDNIVSVAATASNDKKAPFSNYGSTTVDIAAPGVGILSTVRNDGYAKFQGTSMAAPHVAGAAALLLAKNSTLSPVDIKNVLTSTAKHPSNLDRTVPGGRLDVAAALGSISTGSLGGSGSSSSGGGSGSSRRGGGAGGLIQADSFEDGFVSTGPLLLFFAGNQANPTFFAAADSQRFAPPAGLSAQAVAQVSSVLSPALSAHTSFASYYGDAETPIRDGHPERDRPQGGANKIDMGRGPILNASDIATAQSAPAREAIATSELRREANTTVVPSADTAPEVRSSAAGTLGKIFGMVAAVLFFMQGGLLAKSHGPVQEEERERRRAA